MRHAWKSFSNWASRDLWAKTLKALQIRIDKTGAIVDGSVIRAHQGAQGGRGGSSETIWAALEEAQ